MGSQKQSQEEMTEMQYEDESARIFNFVTGLLLGAVVGAGVALLLAPQSGRRTRRRIRRAAEDLRDSTADRWEALSGEVRGRVDEAVAGARKRAGS